MTTPLPPTDPSTADEPLPGEAELAALYRQLPHNEPGPALDAAVLRAAAHALSGGDEGRPEGMTERRKLPREKLIPLPATPASPATSPTLQSIEYAARARRKRAPHWLIALGSAASLVLVAGLAWRMRDTAPPAPAPAAQRMATPLVSPSKPVIESPAPAAPSPMLRQGQPAEQLAGKVADKPAMMNRQAGATRSVARPSAADRRTNALPPAVAEESVSRRAAAAPPLGGTGTHVEQAPAPPPMAVPAAAPMAKTLSAAPAPSADAATETDTRPQPSDTPVQELDKISRLFAQGHDGEALQRLRTFQQAHPQWPLPPALRARLRQP